MNEQVRQREGFVADAPPAKSASASAKSASPTPTSAPTSAPASAPVAAPTEPERYVETWPIKVKLLHHAIRDDRNQEVSELSFREPTAGDINRWGNPVRIDQNGDLVIDERKMTMVLAALSGMLPPLLERMDPRDWNSCAYRLRGFFLPDPAAW